MQDFYYRTEDLPSDQIQDLYVPTKQDLEIVAALKSRNPTILQGSRGTGKSFLLRIAQIELVAEFSTSRVLPVYVSFVRSSLIHTNDPLQFRNWMLARVCSRLVRALNQQGLLVSASPTVNILAGGQSPRMAVAGSKMDTIVRAYEESYRDPGRPVDANGVPDVEALKDVIEDLCEQLNIQRICFLFDEAAHIFRPEQQRQFFTLFRDLRCPFVTCNAAVYPGVTSYGPTFQPAHDATFVRIDRNVLEDAYIANMREIVEKQAPTTIIKNIERRGENFAVLAYAVSGNPRILLKTVAQAPGLRAAEVSETIKTFYRSDIWSEHSALGNTYVGHKKLVDWGRTFIEDTVLPATKTRNDQWRDEGKAESTCYFWLHNSAPENVREALRLLEYTGIVTKGDEWIRTTRSETGTRYAVNLGCLFALEPNPAATAHKIAKNLTLRRFTEIGANHAAFSTLTVELSQFENPDPKAILGQQLNRDINVLDITEFQKEKLRDLALNTVGEVLKADEATLQQAYYVGQVRSRQMMNAAHASVLEYLSG